MEEPNSTTYSQKSLSHESHNTESNQPQDHESLKTHSKATKNENILIEDSNIQSDNPSENINEFPAEVQVSKEETPLNNQETLDILSSKIETEEHFEEQLSKLEEDFNEIEEKMQKLEQSLYTPVPEPSEPIQNIENRLREAETDKNKVEVLLQQVKSSIEGIKSLEIFSETHRKPNFQPKDQPVEKYEEQKKKSELNALRLKKFRKDQKKREILLKKELEKINGKICQEQELLRDEQAKQNEAKKDEYRQELEKMREKKEKRKQELEEIKRRQHDLEAIKNNKPMYKKIEENYKKVLKQDEDLYKNELEKNKKGHAHVNVVEIAEHARWYENVKKEHEKQKEKIEKVRSISTGLTTVWTNRVLEEDQKLKRDLNRASQERLNMIEKKTKYAEFVKEMFLPTIDRLKKQEKALSKSPHREKKILSPIREDKVVNGSDYEVRQNKRKWKENPMVPKPVQKRPPVVADYLNDRRVARQEEEPEEVHLDWERDLEGGHSAEELMKILKKKAQILEKKARKQELLTRNNPTDVDAIKQNEQVNDMLLGSIKAKLAVLEKISS